MKLYLIVSPDECELPEIVGASVKEIADKMGISYESAKVRFSKSKNPNYSHKSYIKRFKVVEVEDE